MERWSVVRALVDFPGRKPGGSLARLGLHLPDVARVAVADLTLALASEVSRDAADRLGARLHAAFADVPPGRRGTQPFVDARYVAATHRAVLLAPLAFRDPRAAYLKLLQEFEAEGDGGGAGRSWRLDDVLWVASIAAVTDDGVKSTAGLLRQSIRTLTTESIITKDLLTKALALESSVLVNFRSQMVSQLPDTQHLQVLSGEEVSSTRYTLGRSLRVQLECSLVPCS